MGDTIKLYEKVTNVDSVPITISRNDSSQPVLVLYKKGEKYYGFSDDISESENLDNAIRTKNKSPYLFIKFSE